MGLTQRLPKRHPEAEKIRKERQGPLIGIIGATMPDDGYNPMLAFLTASLLRKRLDKGTIFTGGVAGVGVDAYFGIVSRCMMENEIAKKAKMPSEFGDDKFFILIPFKHVVQQQKGHGEFIAVSVPYDPPAAYEKMALSASLVIREVRAGRDMDERREILGGTAHGVICINGGMGTLDEAEIALKLGTPVIALRGSGGAADMLAQAKKLGGFPPRPRFADEEVETGIKPCPWLKHVGIADTPDDAASMALEAVWDNVGAALKPLANE